MNNIADDLHRAYEDGFRDGKPKWISVKDDLPKEIHDNSFDGETWKESDLVLVCGSYGGYAPDYGIARLCDGDWNGSVCDIEASSCFITHWMPLPDLPKEAKHG